ncbi:tyrosine-type recombinase/integrase [Dehalococcoidia bacterium]|nr:tyrosine-type recombinase/integrase [Dehalococcoidia bacterium]
MAKILGISPSYLSLLINGKRKWWGDLRKRYETLVNTFVNREENHFNNRMHKTEEIVTNANRGWSWRESNSLPLQCHEKLEEYLSFLSTRNLSDTYIEGNRIFLKGFVNKTSIISTESAIKYLSVHNHLSQNSKARYAGYLKGFLKYLGMDFDISIKRPHLLPEHVYEKDIEKLKETIANHMTHKGSVFRDLMIIETAIKTGMRRAELADLLVRHINFGSGSLTVARGKGSRDRVIPMGETLELDLKKLCCDKQLNDRVFGLTPQSLGLKINDWAKKSNVPIHTHSFRHYFATKLVERGANIKVVQELLGHASLNTTQVYLSVTVKHLEETIQLLEN